MRKLRTFGVPGKTPDLAMILRQLEAIIEDEEIKPMNWQGPLAKRLEKAKDAATLLSEIVESQ